MKQLRSYQIRAIERVVETWEECPEKGALIELATGTGKTRTGLAVCIQESLARGGRVCWAAHREELVLQAYDSLVGPKGIAPEYRSQAGIVMAARNDVTARVVFASVQTLDYAARMEAVLQHGAFDLVVIDEAHHAPSTQHSRVIAQLTASGARVLYLTATAEREDGKSLAEFAEMAFAYGVVDAIRDGWLIEPYAAVTPVPELVRSERRDYEETEDLDEKLIEALVNQTVTSLGEIQTGTRLPFRDHQKMFTPKGRSWLVFCITIEQAKRTTEALNKAGWTARYVTGKTPDEDRKRLIKQFSQGKIEILVNCGILTEGTDIPRCDGVVNARTLGSWSLFCQVLGRGLRLFDPQWDDSWGLCNAKDPRYRGKTDCILIDLSGASDRHSIVSAPILVGGTPCADSPNGTHEFVQNQAGKAVCSHCGTTRACWESVNKGGSGRHDWQDDGRCKHCNKPQCEYAPKLRHEWIPQADHKRLCMFCGAETKNPLAGVLRREAAAEAEKEGEEDTRFLSLLGLSPETWAVDLGDHGTILIVGDRDTDRWVPYWAPVRGKRPRQLAEPVEGRLARAIAKDAIRKTEKVLDKRKGRAMFGGQGTDRASHHTRQKAADLAVRLEVSRRKEGQIHLTPIGTAYGFKISVPVGGILEYEGNGAGGTFITWSTEAGNPMSRSVQEPPNKIKELIRNCK